LHFRIGNVLQRWLAASREMMGGATRRPDHGIGGSCRGTGNARVISFAEASGL
jgi:hypothetical protein